MPTERMTQHVFVILRSSLVLLGASIGQQCQRKQKELGQVPKPPAMTTLSSWLPRVTILTSLGAASLAASNRLTLLATSQPQRRRPTVVAPLAETGPFFPATQCYSADVGDNGSQSAIDSATGAGLSRFGDMPPPAPKIRKVTGTACNEDQIVDIHAPHEQEETVLVPKIAPEEWFIQQTVEQDVEIPSSMRG